jgi:hypothetical protein
MATSDRNRLDSLLHELAAHDVGLDRVIEDLARPTASTSDASASPSPTRHHQRRSRPRSTSRPVTYGSLVTIAYSVVMPPRRRTYVA